MICAFLFLEINAQIYRADGPLSGYQISAEKNPGGFAQTNVLEEDDVAIRHTKDFTEIIANPLRRRSFVNAVGTIKFIDRTPDGSAIRLGRYRYECQVKLPNIPNANGGGPVGDAIQVRIQFWDGSGRLVNTERQSIEAAIYWATNPSKPNFSHILLLSQRDGKNELIDTGVIVKPDESWRRFSVECDLKSQSYKSISIDNLVKEIRSLPLARSLHPDWPRELSLRLTTEATNNLPPNDIDHASTWVADFRNVRLFWRG